jgi:hypothetical protein
VHQLWRAAKRATPLPDAQIGFPHTRPNLQLYAPASRFACGDRLAPVDSGEIIDYELNLTFVHFGSLVQGLSTSGNREGGSEQIRVGASMFEKPPKHDVERFLSMLGLDFWENVNALAVL